MYLVNGFVRSARGAAHFRSAATSIWIWILPVFSISRNVLSRLQPEVEGFEAILMPTDYDRFANEAHTERIKIIGTSIGNRLEMSDIPEVEYEMDWRTV